MGAGSTTGTAAKSTNLKHMCAALGIDVGTPAHMKMAIEIRLRDLKFGKCESFEPTADEWAVCETDDTVHEKLLGIQGDSLKKNL